MSVHIDITGLRQERVAFAPSPLGELCMALHALSEPGHHPGLQGWVTGVTARLDPHLADRMCEADFLWRSTFSDLFLPYAGIPGRQHAPRGHARRGAGPAGQADGRAVRGRGPGVHHLRDLLQHGQGPGPLTDAGIRRRALEQAAARGPHQLAFTERLLADPPRTRAWLRQFLEDCDEAFFAETWSRLHHQLAADARHKTDLLHRKGLAEALTSMSPR
jgi:hypothetical protein